VSLRFKLTFTILVLTVALVSCSTNGSNLVIVPDVRGKRIEVAKEELAKLGLKVEIEEGEYYASIPSDYVVTQNPYPFTKVRFGRKVRIIVSKGITKVIVPDVKGLLFADGREKLTRENLKVGNITEVEGQSYGVIVSQNPLPGTEVQAEAYVDLTISVSKPPSVPNLIDIHFEDAKKIITDNGYVLGKVIFKESSSHPRGVVIQQEPIPDSKAEIGSVIDIIVNEKP